MAIYKLIANGSFGPDEIEIMKSAYEAALWDHFLGYFAATSIVWLAWPKRPFVVGGSLMVLAVVLEALQVFTPDRHADLRAALFGACGALTQALLAALFIRVRAAYYRHRFLKRQAS